MRMPLWGGASGFRLLSDLQQSSSGTSTHSPPPTHPGDIQGQSWPSRSRCAVSSCLQLKRCPSRGPHQRPRRVSWADGVCSVLYYKVQRCFQSSLLFRWTPRCLCDFTTSVSIPWMFTGVLGEWVSPPAEIHPQFFSFFCMEAALLH